MTIRQTGRGDFHYRFTTLIVPHLSNQLKQLRGNLLTGSNSYIQSSSAHVRRLRLHTIVLLIECIYYVALRLALARVCVPLAPLRPDFRPTAATLVFTYGAPRPYTDRSLPFFFSPVGQKISFHLSAINTSEYPEHVAGVWAGMFCFTRYQVLAST